MNQFKLLLLLNVVLLFSALSCEEKSDSEFPLSFELQLLNSKGEKSTSLKTGEIFSFRFIITNQSDVAINIADIVSLSCDKNNDLFRVYKKDVNIWLNLGKSCFIPCAQQGVVYLESKSVHIIESKWIDTDLNCENENAPLPQGTFKTSFTHHFIIQGGKYDGIDSNKSFNIDFDIQ